MNKIYVISDSDGLEFDMKHPANLEDVVDFAERSGKVYTTKGFLKAFNSGEINSYTDTLFVIQPTELAIEIESSHGEFSIDRNGFIYEMDGEDYLLDIKRVDYDEYQDFISSLGWDRHSVDSADILAFGFWDKNGNYSKPDAECRFNYNINPEFLVIEDDNLYYKDDNLKLNYSIDLDGDIEVYYIDRFVGNLTVYTDNGMLEHLEEGEAGEFSGLDYTYVLINNEMKYLKYLIK